MSVKDEFIAELNPLLIASEEAITAGDRFGAKRLALQALGVVGRYRDRLSAEELRDALNNSVANSIAERLGIKR